MNRLRSVEELASEARHLAGQAQELLAKQRQAFGVATPEPQAAPPPLAHYTTLTALVSMLQGTGGGLRLSDSSTMNDPLEGRSTRDGRMLSHLLEEFGTDSWARNRYGAAHVCCFVGVAPAEEEPGSGHTVVVGDDLLFWRLYGDECRGVSISIPAHLSERLAASSFVQRVIYTDEPPLEVDVTAIEKLLRELERFRERARRTDAWPAVGREVLGACDLLMSQRFLQKRPHYRMESEYRAIRFVTVEDGAVATVDDGEPGEGGRFLSHGRHVSYGRVRTFVQPPELQCQSIFTTGSQLTIGSNVPDGTDARRAVKKALEPIGLAPNVVGIDISKIEYRS